MIETKKILSYYEPMKKLSITLSLLTFLLLGCLSCKEGSNQQEKELLEGTSKETSRNC